MTKFVYTYNKVTKEYQVSKDGISSATFKHLRDCKLSWKMIKNIKVTSSNGEVIVWVR